MDFVKRQRSCVLVVLLFGLIGIVLTSYHLGFGGQDSALLKKQVKHESLKKSVVMNTKTAPGLTKEEMNDVRVFLFFAGYPRSSHSILASMIDAHPNAIVAHEFNLFPKLVHKHELLTNRSALYNALYDNSYKQASRGWRSLDHSFKSKGYTLNMNSSQSWQGRFRRLRVIGDKSGGLTSRMYQKSPANFTKLYTQLSKLVKVPVKVIHMIRNPYDMVATQLKYRFSAHKNSKANFTSEHPLNNPGNVSQAIKALYNEANAVHNMIEQLNMYPLEIHNVNFVNDSRHEMQRLCEFLTLKCSVQYLDMVTKNTYPQVSVTRHSVVWSKEAREFVDSKILQIPFFNRYTFDTPF